MLDVMKPARLRFHAARFRPVREDPDARFGKPVQRQMWSLTPSQASPGDDVGREFDRKQRSVWNVGLAEFSPIGTTTSGSSSTETP